MSASVHYRHLHEVLVALAAYAVCCCQKGVGRHPLRLSTLQQATAACGCGWSTVCLAAAG